MKQAKLTERQQRLLDHFSNAGGVVDFVIFDADVNTSDQQLHREAVLLALKEIQRQIDDCAERTSKRMRISKSRIFQVDINEHAAEKLIPRQITWKEFLGSRYDFDRRGLIVRGKGDFLNEFFFYRDPAKREKIIPPDGIDWGVGSGFAYAFSAPPHPIQLTAEELGELLNKFLEFLICGSDKSTIFEWPTDWSNYFDAGKEWWGSFLWSVSSPDSSRIIVIAASTTD